MLTNCLLVSVAQLSADVDKCHVDSLSLATDSRISCIRGPLASITIKTNGSVLIGPGVLGNRNRDVL
eukprot:8907713-Pyramimonas_sp.AAC.1